MVRAAVYDPTGIAKYFRTSHACGYRGSNARSDYHCGADTSIIFIHPSIGDCKIHLLGSIYSPGVIPFIPKVGMPYHHAVRVMI